MNLIETAREGAVLVISMNRPEKRNALNEPLMDALETAIATADLDGTVRCIIVRGNGKDFCAGYDIAAYDDSSRAADLESGDVISDRRRLRKNSRRWQSLWELDTPVIAEVHGNCIAGGFEMALMCDLVVVAEDARVGFPAVRALGTPPMNSLAFLLGPRLAKEMVLTGAMLTGQRAYDLGLVNRVAPSANVHEIALDVAANVARVPAELLALNKAAVNHACEVQGFRAGIELGYEMDALAHTLPVVKEWFRTAQAEGLASALKHRDEQFTEGF